MARHRTIVVTGSTGLALTIPVASRRSMICTQVAGTTGVGPRELGGGGDCWLSLSQGWPLIVQLLCWVSVVVFFRFLTPMTEQTYQQNGAYPMSPMPR